MPVTARRAVAIPVSGRHPVAGVPSHGGGGGVVVVAGGTVVVVSGGTVDVVVVVVVVVVVGGTVVVELVVVGGVVVVVVVDVVDEVVVVVVGGGSVVLVVVVGGTVDVVVEVVVVVVVGGVHSVRSRVPVFVCRSRCVPSSLCHVTTNTRSSDTTSSIRTVTPRSYWPAPSIDHHAVPTQSSCDAVSVTSHPSQVPSTEGGGHATATPATTTVSVRAVRRVAVRLTESPCAVATVDRHDRHR